MMVESKDKESRAIAKNFVGYVHVKDALNKQFNVYHQLNSSFIKDKDSAKVFVGECLSTLDEFKFKDILHLNRLVESKFKVDKMDSTEINKAIANLIRYKTSTEKRNPEEYVNSLKFVVEHVTTVREETDMLSELDSAFKNSELKFLQPKHIVRIALKKFNDRYVDKFDVEDRMVFNTLREGNEVKVNRLFKKTITALETEMSAAFQGYDNIDLEKKLQEAYGQVATGYSQSNLLDAHELCSELKRLREDS